MSIELINFDQEPLSTESIQIRNVALDLYPDRRRVKVRLSITPFMTPPNIEIDVHDSSGNRVANATIIGASGPNLDLTLHLRGEVPAGDYNFSLVLGYQDNEAIDRREVVLNLPESENLR